MSTCGDCKFWERDEGYTKAGKCLHPMCRSTLMSSGESCPYLRSTEWRGCLISFPKTAIIVSVCLFDMLVYFIFGKTIYKKTYKKEDSK